MSKLDNLRFRIIEIILECVSLSDESVGSDEQRQRE